MPRLLTRDFNLLVAAHLLQAVGWSTMLLLPLYLAFLGGSRLAIGVVMASAAVGGLLLRPAVGWSLDRWGRKPTLVVGTLTMVVAMVGMALVDSVGALIIGLRVVFGAGTGALFTGYFTLATDLIPDSRRTEGIALFGISGLVPLAINPLSEVAGVSGSDIRWFLPVMGGLLLLSLVPLAMVNESKDFRLPSPPPWRAVLAELRRPALWPAWLATLVFASMVVLFMSFASVTAQARGLSNPSSFWFTYALGAVGIRLFGARMPDRLGPANLVIPALGIEVAGALVLATATDASTFQLAGLLGGLGHGIGFPVLTSQVATRAPAHLRGSALALFTGLWDLSFLATPPLLGLVADRWGDSTMLSGTATFALIAMGLWVLMEHRLGGGKPTEV
ncbi:MAG: MFS transporter [Myxococcales bacterium]|nr:MFS transporter [Myxococcales bacterium]